MDSVHSFIGSFYHTTYSDFIAVTTQFYFVFLNKKTFQLIFMWLWKCKYICVQVCIYVVMLVLPTPQNALCGYFNEEVFQLIHQRNLDIVPQKKFLFGKSLKFLNTIFKHQRRSLMFFKNPLLTQLCDLDLIWAKLMQPYVPGKYIS